MFLLAAFAQPIQSIGDYVEDWCPEELTGIFLSVVPPVDLVSDPITHTDTMTVFIISANKSLMAIFLQWFLEFIISTKKIIHVCYIFEFYRTRRKRVSIKTFLKLKKYACILVRTKSILH